MSGLCAAAQAPPQHQEANRRDPAACNPHGHSAQTARTGTTNAETSATSTKVIAPIPRRPMASRCDSAIAMPFNQPCSSPTAIARAVTTAGDRRQSSAARPPSSRNEIVVTAPGMTVEPARNPAPPPRARHRSAQRASVARPLARSDRPAAPSSRSARGRQD